MLSGFSRPSQRTLAYLLASARNPSPEGLSFESLLRVEISFWYSAHHPLRREQTADRSIEVRGNSM
jgi:hypothetical protein